MTNAKAALGSGFWILVEVGGIGPRSNPPMKEILRRVVSVIFKTGCEERRRNHSCPIPYLDAPGGRPSIDLTDNSACLPRCERRKKTNVAHVTPKRRRGRTQSHSYRSTVTSRLQECSWQVWFPASFKW